MFRKQSLFVACVAAVVGLASLTSYAGTIVDFMPQPASPVTPELVWTGSALTVGAGAVGNGDGALPTADQTAPGLQLVAPFEVNGVTGSQVDTNNLSTTFYDTTLELTGLTAFGPTYVTQIFFGYSFVTQILDTGTFAFWNTDHSTQLLAGTINSAAITGPLNNSVGGVGTVDLAVTYTGGAILTAAGFSGGTGQFSWSLLDITPKLATVGTSVQTLAPFTANAVGQFTGDLTLIPEPTTVALLGFAGLALIARVRGRRNV